MKPWINCELTIDEATQKQLHPKRFFLLHNSIERLKESEMQLNRKGDLIEHHGSCLLGEQPQYLLPLKNY